MVPSCCCWSESIGTIAVAYNFGPNGRPSNLSEWGIPVGNNHGSSCGTTGPGEDNLLFLLLFLRFGDGGPTVGVESFLRGNLQVQFGGRRASTQPYEYSDYNSSDEQSLTFDSYTIPEDDLELGQLRLLEVDNRVVVPAKSHLRIIVTSADVLHSWAVPSPGVKCDAVPGRLNQTSISVQREGVYYDRPTAEPTLAQPHHPGCEPPEKQAITASGWSSMEPRSKAVDKIEEGVRLPVEQRIRSCEGGQSKIVLFLYKDNRRSQRLGATLFLSYSSFFMISCRGEQTKQKRGPSQRKEKDLQRQRLLTLFLFLAVFYESGKPPQRDPKNRIEKGGQGFRKSLPPLPGQDRWEGALSRP
ncbi:unnamed protein product [Lactuca saligna]|uniref:Cytochrome c oxidase polypeptide II n=1 Tax=Lactuca saligna TaxID=75948 RepID=A0AA35VF08_LACSI|nr:unnamed protein product [Lactuca saligna]